jgi:adenosine deaminase
MDPDDLLAIRRLPKIDLHRHLEGSLRLESLAEIVRLEGLDLPAEAEALSRLVQIQAQDPPTGPAFLAKFEPLRQIYRSPEIVRRLVREAVRDAALDGVRYLELRFNPAALAKARGFALGEVMDWVCEAAEETATNAGILVRFIVSVNRHEPVGLAEDAVGLAVERKGRGIVGLDLAGREWDFPAAPFASLFAETKKEGLRVTVHAGEWSDALGVRQAVEALGADRVGHGVQVVGDADVVAMARERRIVFEVCLTSNVQSGVVPEMAAHPLPRMLEAGLQVTLNSDDPAISRITLGGEYALAVRDLGLSIQTLRGMILTAAQASFLPARERKSLEAALQAEIFGGV